MKYRSQYDLFDPEVIAEDPMKEFEDPSIPDAPEEAFTIGERGNTIKAPDGSAASDLNTAPKPWAKPLAIALMITCIGLTAWNISRMIKGPPPLPPPNPTQVKQTLYLGMMRIEAYRKEHGVTPEKLVDAGLPENSGYSYQRVDAWHYVVGFENGGPKLEYSSSIPKETFFGSPQALLTMGEKE